MERTRVGILLAEHITYEISCHFLLLVVVMKLNAELLFKRVDNV